MFVWSRDELQPWLTILRFLADEGNALRYIELVYFWHRSGPKRGMGDNVEFVRALARIQGLEKLVIKGYYAESWPAYLSEKLGVQVRAFRGHASIELMVKTNQVEYEERVREMREIDEKEFEEYQEGIKGLVP